MRQRRFGSACYMAFGLLQWSLGVATVAFSASIRADLTKIPSWASSTIPMVAWLQQWAWLGAICALFLGLANVLQRQFGPPWAWLAIHKSLDLFRQQAFPTPSTDNPDPVHFHRITLFRYCSWRACFRRWPWSGWLVVAERSGHSTLRSTTCFRVSDDGRKVQGFAGMTWERNSLVIVNDLPDLIANQSPDAVEEYSRKTGVTPEWVRERIKMKAKLARSFCGIPVEVKGRLWGVVVLDSMDPKGTNWESVRQYKTFGKVIETLVERV
jgi:hypothetical protein